MGWHNIIKFLEQVRDHSTLVGKYWITSFFLIRMLIVFQIGSKAWGGSQGNFVCNTQSPGCKNVCFNEYSPIALPSYWAIQLLFVALPSVIYIVYIAYKLARVNRAIAKKQKKEKDDREMAKKIKKEKIEKAKKRAEEAGRVYVPEPESDDDEAEGKDDGKVISSKIKTDVPTKLYLGYFFMILARFVIDICFMIGQYYLYTFKFVMPELFQCQHWPCPNTVDCFVSRPKEKTIFICMFYITGCVMAVLNLMEMYHLADKIPEAWSKRHEDITKDLQDGPTFGGNLVGHPWGYTTNTGYPDVAGIPTVYPVQYNSNFARRRGFGFNRRRRR